MSVGLQLTLAWAGSITVAVALWPRRPYLAATAWILVYVAMVAILWEHTGVGAAVLATIAWIHIVRAFDAAASNRDLSRAAYFRYVLFTVLVPPREQVDPPSRRESWWLVPRGFLLVACAAGLGVLGTHVQPWRIHPYLDDLWLTVEVGVFFTGVCDLTWWTAVNHQFRAPRPHHPLFFAASSIREFWGARWNVMFGRSLHRAISPLFGRRHLGLGVLAAFILSGVVHGAPALLAHPNRALCGVLVVACFLFFVLHGLAVLAERKLTRRSARRTRRVLLWVVWALTIPFFPGPVGPAFGIHDRPPQDLTLFHLAPGLAELADVDAPEAPPGERRTSKSSTAHRPVQTTWAARHAGTGSAVPLAHEPRSLVDCRSHFGVCPGDLPHRRRVREPRPSRGWDGRGRADSARASVDRRGRRALQGATPLLR